MSNKEENRPENQSHSQMQITDTGKRNIKANGQELSKPKTQPPQHQVEDQSAGAAAAPEVKKRADEGRDNEPKK
ncbi:MAG: hypothetical protein IT316_01995 [Anaerolineales bacterium]|nr:hypothetical protein [Anaerolineales bacterium]